MNVQKFKRIAESKNYATPNISDYEDIIMKKCVIQCSNLGNNDFFQVMPYVLAKQRPATWGCEDIDMSHHTHIPHRCCTDWAPKSHRPGSFFSSLSLLYSILFSNFSLNRSYSSIFLEGNLNLFVFWSTFELNIVEMANSNVGDQLKVWKSNLNQNNFRLIWSFFFHRIWFGFCLKY